MASAQAGEVLGTTAPVIHMLPRRVLVAGDSVVDQTTIIRHLHEVLGAADSKTTIVVQAMDGTRSLQKEDLVEEGGDLVVVGVVFLVDAMGKTRGAEVEVLEGEGGALVVVAAVVEKKATLHENAQIRVGVVHATSVARRDTLPVNVQKEEEVLATSVVRKVILLESVQRGEVMHATNVAR